MRSANQKIAIVTGANRGIGREVARELAKKGVFVILGVRNRENGIKIESELKKERCDVEYWPLDVTEMTGIDHFFEGVMQTYGGVDILVNNAGIFLERDGQRDVSLILKSLETNCLGPYRLCELFVPQMIKRGYGRVVNISSGMGQLCEMESGYPGYRISKAALNAVTRIFAAEAAGVDVLVNSVCPGWVKTEMGGPKAERSVEQGADTVVWLATLPQGGPTGGFFRDRREIPW